MKSKFKETQEREQKLITEQWIYFSTGSKSISLRTKQRRNTK